MYIYIYKLKQSASITKKRQDIHFISALFILGPGFDTLVGVDASLAVLLQSKTLPVDKKGQR